MHIFILHNVATSDSTNNKENCSIFISS